MRLSQIPDWLRWLLFFPVAIVALAIVYPIVMIGNDLLSPVGQSVLFKAFTVIIAAGASGFAFIWCGAMIAPRKQFIVAAIMTALYISLSVLFFVTKIQVKGVITVPWFEFVAVTAVGSAGAVMACIAVKSASTNEKQEAR